MHKIKKFFAYYRPYKKLVFLDLFCAFLASIASLMYPILVKVITGQALLMERPAAVELIVKVTAVMIFLAAVEYAGNYFITYYGHLTGARMEFDMRNDLFNHLQKLSFSYYDNAKTGQLMSRITSDLFDVTELAHHGPEDVVISLVKIIGSFIILINVNAVLTLVLFAVLPFMIIFSYHYNIKMKRAFKKNRERIADINAQIEDSISGIRVVKSFANEELELEKFVAGNSRFVQSKRESYQYMGRFHSGLSLFISVINILVVTFGAAFILQGYIELQDLITFVLYIGLLVEPVRKLINFTEQFQNGATGFERFLDILAVEPDIADSPGAVTVKDVKGKIEFCDVSFRYSKDTEGIFKNLSLTAQPGDYIALVGSSGVGKTTLCSLIPRFYDVSGGEILLDGIDIRHIKIKSLREKIGVVQQDVYLFAGTIMDNIGYGKKDATEEEIIRAAKNANAHDFITKLPDGYDTYVGQRGVKLSGGQKQRLSIARVFLKNPPILIFDEATSALDNDSEKIVQESFDRLAENRTTFVIAHRLSTIKNAGRIMVLTEDGIAEDGTHWELLSKNGIYTRLYNLQFSNLQESGAQ